MQLSSVGILSHPGAMYVCTMISVSKLAYWELATAIFSLSMWNYNIYGGLNADQETFTIETLTIINQDVNLHFYSIVPWTTVVSIIQAFTAVSLCLFTISQNFCPWQAFPAQSIVCGRGAYPSEAPFRCSAQGQAPDFTHKHQMRLERLASNKCSSLL